MPVIGHYEVRAQVGKPGIGKQVILWQGDGDAGGVGAKAQRAFTDAVALIALAPLPGVFPLDALSSESPLLPNVDRLVNIDQWTEIVIEGPNGLFNRVPRAEPLPNAAPVL